MEVDQKKKETIWVAHSLFNRGKATGSTANISFRHEDKIYISASGTCFGTLKEEEFAVLDLKGEHIAGPKPSKEAPLHLLMYQKKGSGAVIHTHSFYSTLWSCLPHESMIDIMPEHTPYLKMKLGKVGLIPYAPPGSRELFGLFEEYMEGSDGYLLQNHGPVVGAASMMDAFYAIEELEESARIAWSLRQVDALIC
ncbi:class II aldolase [Claveliimonas bilis]|uniref:class II aldolase/adducin family protein n=1 Tax=Claveliimonas bilis TaxID=3028070 RepID=UPI001E4B466E|nr:class II aldolase/adducin family protein [Claveliimonas bilis]BCZ27834.1 class II aldolase [Claveliimonas bilis]BDZ83412.1 class II aldolase [Claveliimonas bilis]